MTQLTESVAGNRSGVATRADGGRVAFAESGPWNGYPIFFLHGTPGSRIGVLPRPFELSRRRVRLIAIDRPGYGMSDRRAGRDVASVAQDVLAVADELGLETFSVSGRSGGGPHALACGALLPDRVRSVVALVSIAPYDAPGLDWYAGMIDSNVAAYQLTRAALDNPALMPAMKLSLAVDTGALATDFIAERLFDELPVADRRIVSDSRIRGLLLAGFRNAVTNPDNLIALDPAELALDPAEPVPTYLAGQFDDHVAFCSPWGFDPADIRCPTLVWHGGTDVHSPPGHSRWLASRIPHAVLDVDPGEAHFGAVRYFPHLLGWMVKAGAQVR
ncbi:alpha/beta hydrolase [Catenulispora sp. NF23]|uniref:Alpha/beta hydrolase n=1 Tax=Catenulispora pinistramenti TaxID=2705254 RepID=A0ABS5KT80_9ACTN|nr:alpha/beta hydrolase [Catenulispora pinistramenti]MBS2535059.1 alpha/beta hydrolase [Catenulispora pinistramenti]MBS2549225.1 alpha/beta hydrolase [Catenulispora pinistramenti]